MHRSKGGMRETVKDPYESPRHRPPREEGAASLPPTPTHKTRTFGSSTRSTSSRLGFTQRQPDGCNADFGGGSDSAMVGGLSFRKEEAALGKWTFWLVFSLQTNGMAAAP